MMKTFVSFLILMCGAQANAQMVSVSSYQPISLFQWQDNYFMIVVENTSCANLVVKADRGKLITNNNCRYVYSVSDTSNYEVKISVGVKTGNSVKWVEEKFYRIRPYPTPWVRLGYKTEGSVSKSLLLKNPEITVPVTNAGQPKEIPKIQQVTSYAIRITRMDSVLYERKGIPGSVLTAEALDFLKTSVVRNDSLVISDVGLKLYEKESRKGNDIRLRIVDP